METATPVLYQRCVLTIDTSASSITGSVEVTVSVSEGQSNVILHANGLTVHSVTLDGAFLVWGLNAPSLVPLPDDWKQKQVKEAATELARMSFLQFKHLRECTQRPGLCIKLPTTVEATSPKQLTLKIAYTVVNPSGFIFTDGYGFTRNDGFDGVCSWMPCNQINCRNTAFEFEVTVHSEELVICSGQLLKTAFDDAKTHKTFHYQVRGLLCLWRLCLCIGRFDPYSCCIKQHDDDDVETSPNTFVSCFGPKGSAKAMAYTMKIFPPIFRYVEEILASTFPFDNLKVVFLPDLVPVTIGCNECIMLSSLLLLSDDRTLDYGLHYRLEICSGLTKVWFGAIVVVKTPADQWLLEGLIGWLMKKITIRLLGSNEYHYRRAQEHKLLCSADNGALPPLCPRNGIQEMLGLEWHHYRDLFRSKSTSVIWMIEERVSHEAFKRVIERLVSCAVKECEAPQSATHRLVFTKSFLKEVGQAGGIKKEISAFAERWIYGTGCPTIGTKVGFEAKTFSLLLSMTQEGPEACMNATAKAVEMSRDGSIGLIRVSVGEATSIAFYTVPLGAERTREARFKLHGRPRKKRRMEGTVSITENQSPVKWVRVNSDYAMLASIQTKQTEEMWSAMLEESKDILAESEAISGLLSLDSPSLTICKTLETFIRTAPYCRVRMEAILALGQLSCQENGFEGLRFLAEFYRSRRFDPATSLPSSNAFLDLSELLVDQTIPLALGSIRDEDGYTPKEAVELVVTALEFNDNEDNDFDDAEWLVSLCHGLEKVVVNDPGDWKTIFAVIDRYLVRDSACLSVIGSASLHQSVGFRLKVLQLLATYADPEKYKPKTRASAVLAAIQISASILGPDEAVFNGVNWCLHESSVYVCNAIFRKMMSLINLFGAKARGKHGIQWRTVELLYEALHNPKLSGACRHDCLLLLLTIADESVSLYRRPTDWILTNPSQVTPEPFAAVDLRMKKKLKFKIH